MSVHLFSAYLTEKVLYPRSSENGGVCLWSVAVVAPGGLGVLFLSCSVCLGRLRARPRVRLPPGELVSLSPV